MTEEQRLRIKCNQYAKRLVNLGEDDVSWESEPKLQNRSSKELQKCTIPEQAKLDGCHAYDNGMCMSCLQCPVEK